MDKEDVSHIYNGVAKNWNLATWENMDGTWEHYGKWNKLDKNICHMILFTCGIKKQMKKQNVMCHYYTMVTIVNNVALQICKLLWK